MRTLLLIVVMLFNAAIANAEIYEIIGVGEYYMEDENETLDYVKTQATLRAKLNALEQAQVNLKSNSAVRDANLTEDEIVTIAAGIIYVTNTNESIYDVDGVLVAKSEVKVEVDTDKIAELVDIEIKRRGEQ